MPIPETLPQLQRIAWHDTPVASLAVDFGQRQLCLAIDLCEESADGYVRVKVCFTAIHTLEMHLPALPAGSRGDDLEVYALAVGPAGAGYHAEFTLVTSHGPSATISFYFEEAVVT